MILKDYRNLFIFLIILIISLFVVACQEKMPNYTFEDSKNVAELFILNAPSYSSSGSNLTFISSNTLKCDNCFVFIYTYLSKSTNYGINSNIQQNNEQVKHTISILVNYGQVVGAVIDNQWDELNQNYISNSEIVNFNLDSNIPTYFCKDPRPDVCDETIVPVCNSDNVEFSNSCKACKDKNTKWYIKSTCDKGYAMKIIDDLNKGKITKTSGPAIILLIDGLE